MLHVFRLLQMAEEIATSGELNVRRPNREFLLQIRLGEFQYEELVADAEKLVSQIDTAFTNSNLPDIPDKAVAEALLQRVRQLFYQEAR